MVVAAAAEKTNRLAGGAIAAGANGIAVTGVAVFASGGGGGGGGIVNSTTISATGNGILVGNVAAFALNTEGNAINLGGNTLTLGDGTNAAGLILATGSTISNGTLAFGGSDLQGAQQTYLYFMITDDGTWMVKRRTGSSTDTIMDKTPNAAIKKPDGGQEVRPQRVPQRWA